MERDADVRAVSRALSLLGCFESGPDQMTIRELAARTGIPRSTTHRLASELVRWGALERAEGGLRLGLRIFELGSLLPANLELRELASPFLHALHEACGQTVNLAVRAQHDVVYLEKISSRSLHVPHSRFGGRGALHATALGKAILAFSDTSEVSAIKMRGFTPRTIMTAAQLEGELALIRRTRVAYDLEETREGLFCVAAPILDSQRRAIAAVSVTGAVDREDAERFAPAVLTTALSIGGALTRLRGTQQVTKADRP